MVGDMTHGVQWLAGRARSNCEVDMFEIFDGIMKKRKQNIKMVCADASEQ